MIADVFELKKNSWHAKLMKFIWGYNHTDFPNMCPYFWLTMFNLLLVVVGFIPYISYRILKLLIKPILKHLEDLSIAFDEYCENRKKNWLDNFVEKLVSNDAKYFEELTTNNKIESKIKRDSQILYYARYTDYKPSELKNVLDKESLDKMLVLRENFKKWDALQKEKRRKREKFLAEQRTREQILKQEAIERRKRIGEITVKLKTFFKIIGGIIAAAFVGIIGFLLYKLGVYLTTLNYIVIGKNTLMLLAALGVIAVVMGIIYLIVKGIIFLSCKYGKYCIPCESRRKNIIKFFEWLFIDNAVVKNLKTSIVAVGKGMVEVGSIVKMLYKNNCPPIDWKD